MSGHHIVKVKEPKPIRLSVNQIQAIADWLANGDVGESSLTMASVFLGGMPIDPAHPHDPSDFRRCYDFLEFIPSGRELLPLLSSVCPHWNVLITNWVSLEEIYVLERELESAPTLYQEMKLLGL